MEATPHANPLIKVAALFFGTWAGTILLYLAGILLAALLFGNAQTSTVEIVALVLIAGEVLIACGAVVLFFLRAGNYVKTMARLLWSVAFVALQFVTCIAAIFVTLVMLNR